jgi:hypothetical protein
LVTALGLILLKTSKLQVQHFCVVGIISTGVCTALTAEILNHRREVTAFLCRGHQHVLPVDGRVTGCLVFSFRFGVLVWLTLLCC